MAGVPAPAGRGVYELLREKPLYECFEATVRTGETSERTVRLPDDRVWQVAVAPLPDGHRAAAVGVLRDVSRLEKTESMRRTFVGDVSHELRTPIASIAAAAETLAEGSPDKTETAELLGLIRRQSDRMRELIDDLMDLAQIESGAVPLVREEIPLHELLSEVAEDLEPAARERRVDVRVLGDVSVSAVGRPASCRPARPQPHRQRDQVLAGGRARRRARLAPGRARGLFGRGPRARGSRRPNATRSSSASTRWTGRARRSGPARGWASRSSSTSPSSTAPRSTSKARSARAARSTSASRPVA